MLGSPPSLACAVDSQLIFYSLPFIPITLRSFWKPRDHPKSSSQPPPPGDDNGSSLSQLCNRTHFQGGFSAINQQRGLLGEQLKTWVLNQHPWWVWQVSWMLIFMLLEFLTTWVFKLNLVVFELCMTSRGEGTKSLICIAVFYMQTLDFMVSSSNVWPPKIVAAQKYLSSYWNLYFPSLLCDFPSLFNPVGKFAFILLLPIGCLALVGVYFTVLLSYNKVRPQEQRMENVHFKCRQSAFFCLSFTYFPVVKQTLSILRPCQNDRDVLYMLNSPWIECTSVTYRTLTALSFVSVVVYVIGFPLLLASLVFFFHRKRNSINQDDRDKLDTWLGPAYLPYKQKYQWYFETVMLLRRLMLAIALSMISSSSALQTFMIWVILVGFAIIHLCLHPYGDEDNVHRFASENFFEPLVLLALSMSFILLRFSALEISFIYTTTYVWMVMIVNSCILLLLMGTIFYRLVLTGQVDSNGRNGRDQWKWWVRRKG